MGGDPFSPERGREQVVFAVQDGDFQSGETILATLENHSAQRLGYNLCFAELQLRIEDAWSSVARQEEEHFCTLILLSLAPGQSASFSQPVLAQFPDGLYRFETGIEWPLDTGQRFSVVTESFRIGD